MGKNNTTSIIIEGMLRFGAMGGLISVAVVAPNAVQIFEKPLDKLLGTLDKRSQERELERIIYYMKQQGLITFKTEDYEHGMVLTKKGKLRTQNADYNNLNIAKPKKWDEHWRLIFFDIPETKKVSRNMLVLKLRELGLRQLQRSIWVHPFDCRREIEIISERLDLSKYVSYVVVLEIDNQKVLTKYFSGILK